MPDMDLVVIESPYAGDVGRNLRYLRACMSDCLARNEAPFASHALYTQDGVLDDTKPEERALGMEAGFLWGAKASRTVVYTDLGFSRGMREGIARAEREGRPVEYRSLAGWPAGAVPWCGVCEGRLIAGHLTQHNSCGRCGAPHVAP